MPVHVHMSAGTCACMHARVCVTGGREREKEKIARQNKPGQKVNYKITINFYFNLGQITVLTDLQIFLEKKSYKPNNLWVSSSSESQTFKMILDEVRPTCGITLGMAET